MRSKRSVLISGAGIAGNAIAGLLAHGGFDVTVVERAHQLRDGGQNVDVEGDGREVAERLGLIEAIRAAGTGETGTEFVDNHGGTVALFPASAKKSFTSELEVPRGALVRMLYDHSRDGAKYIFSERISMLLNNDEEVVVAFSDGHEESFDLVIVAEGLRSHTRELLFADAQLHHLGLYMAWFPIPRQATDSQNWRIYHAPGGRALSLRPAKEVMRAMLALRSGTTSYERLSRAAQIEMLHKHFANAGWESERILDGMEPGTLELQPLAQVRAPRWSKGRVVLLGDTAYAPSPLTGQGTSLALIGAYTLAGELACSDDPRVAFARYELLMHPRVKAAQRLPPVAARIALPESRVGVGAVRAVARLVASRPVRPLSSCFAGNEQAGASTLPAYDFSLAEPTLAEPS